MFCREIKTDQAEGLSCLLWAPFLAPLLAGSCLCRPSAQPLHSSGTLHLLLLLCAGQ